MELLANCYSIIKQGEEGVKLLGITQYFTFYCFYTTVQKWEKSSEAKKWPVLLYNDVSY